MDIWFTLFVLGVGLLGASGFALLLVSYLDVLPAAIAHGWSWVLLVVLLPVAGPFIFCHKHWQDFSKTGRQIQAGAGLLTLSVLLLYGLGPYFAERVVAGMPS